MLNYVPKLKVGSSLHFKCPKCKPLVGACPPRNFWNLDAWNSILSCFQPIFRFNEQPVTYQYDYMYVHIYIQMYHVLSLTTILWLKISMVLIRKSFQFTLYCTMYLYSAIWPTEWKVILSNNWLDFFSVDAILAHVCGTWGSSAAKM